jgi:hypothetical protein
LVLLLLLLLLLLLPLRVFLDLPFSRFCPHLSALSVLRAE